MQRISEFSHVYPVGYIQKQNPKPGDEGDSIQAPPESPKFGGEVVESCCGVQQGDPPGPVLFAPTLQPALAVFRASTNASSRTVPAAQGFLPSVGFPVPEIMSSNNPAVERLVLAGFRPV